MEGNPRADESGLTAALSGCLRTDAGKDALILFHEHERMVAEQLAKLEADHLARSKTQDMGKQRTRR
ncbi:hypothetical protein GCM10007856_57650 [Azospirillum oryzae]|nr:hypothetical protein GCM10007856_57650 [Azospirillum oryzae]